MVWEVNGTPDTLTGADVKVEITDLTPKKFLVMLSHILATSGNNASSWERVQSLTSTTYAIRTSFDGSGDATTVNDTKWAHAGNVSTAGTYFYMYYMINIDGKEKLMIESGVESNTAGSANVPHRTEVVGKNTNSGQITDIETLDNSASNEFDTDSNLSTFGTD